MSHKSPYFWMIASNLPLFDEKKQPPQHGAPLGVSTSQSFQVPFERTEVAGEGRPCRWQDHLRQAAPHMDHAPCPQRDAVRPGLGNAPWEWPCRGSIVLFVKRLYDYMALNYICSRIVSATVCFFSQLIIIYGWARFLQKWLSKLLMLAPAVPQMAFSPFTLSIYIWS